MTAALLLFEPKPRCAFHILKVPTGYPIFFNIRPPIIVEGDPLSRER